MSVDRADLRAKAEAASRGEYRTCGARGNRCSCRLVWNETDDAIIAQAVSRDDESMGGEGYATEQAIKNAAFIAAASPAVVLALLDELAAARNLLTAKLPDFTDAHPIAHGVRALAEERDEARAAIAAPRWAERNTIRRGVTALSDAYRAKHGGGGDYCAALGEVLDLLAGAVGQPGTPRPLGYFVHDGETFSRVDTLDAARAEATEALDFWRTEGERDDDWPTQVDGVCYGVVLAQAEAVHDHQSEDDELRCDYRLAEAAFDAAIEPQAAGAAKENT